MATALCNEFRDAALEVIELFGKGYILRKVTMEQPDPERPTTAVKVVKDYPCKAAVVALNEEQIKMLPVQREDMQAIVAFDASLPTEFNMGDQLVDGDNVFTIIPPENVYTVNGEIVAWQLFVRR